ncbi:uncharacterized protein LOC126691910 isoform X2 [Quercus robur]|uniref:uncharacterized protein LOC126691910 isoform X2 n=1 Tax=Quercus robur TaxID=38942 RepID=UPI0021624E11|nr:uncharacterized protein LOC126691910 isoform X2 [Quercus robur]
MKSWTNDGDHYIWIQLWLNFLWTRISIQFHITDPVHIILYMDMDTNCMVAAGWSCTWDFRSLHYINAGLQNGSLLVFDMRQTVGPVNSLNGLTRNPVHMADSILHSSTLTSSVSSVLSASSICLYQWNFDGAEE